MFQCTQDLKDPFQFLDANDAHGRQPCEYPHHIHIPKFVPANHPENKLYLDVLPKHVEVQTLWALTQSPLPAQRHEILLRQFATLPK